MAPDLAAVHQGLKKKSVTLALLWEEYVQAADGPAYQYSRFCDLYRDFARRLKRSMRQVHRAGEKLFIDYVGDTVPIVEAATGEISHAQIFVAVLGASSYTFACATATQSQADWLGALAKVLTFIGGVPELIVPDNTRSRALEEQLMQSAIAALSFEERFAQLIDREVLLRDNKRIERLLKDARIKTAAACLEDVDYRAGRGFERSQIAALATCHWIRQHQNWLVTGPTGSGKTWLACAIANAACRQGLSAYYVRLPRLFGELRLAHADGSFSRRLMQFARVDLIVIDDWGAGRAVGAGAQRPAGAAR